MSDDTGFHSWKETSQGVGLLYKASLSLTRTPGHVTEGNTITIKKID